MRLITKFPHVLTLNILFLGFKPFSSDGTHQRIQARHPVCLAVMPIPFHEVNDGIMEFPSCDLKEFAQRE